MASAAPIRSPARWRSSRRRKRADADIDYTFGAVEINEAKIDFRGNCGNISAGIGPFAIDEGLVPATDPLTLVRHLQHQYAEDVDCPRAHKKRPCRLRRRLPHRRRARHECTDRARLFGHRRLGDGEKLLPTGNVVDEVFIPSLGKVRMSIVDAGNPMCFLRPDVLGLSGLEGPSAPEVAAVLDKVELIRGTAAMMIGMVERADQARSRIPSIPMLAFVSEAADYASFADGRTIAKGDIDFVARLFYMQEMHKTYAGTGTVATGAAAMIEGTLVHQVNARGSRGMSEVRIGHPSGGDRNRRGSRRQGRQFRAEKSGLQPDVAEGSWTASSMCRKRSLPEASRTIRHVDAHMGVRRVQMRSALIGWCASGT